MEENFFLDGKKIEPPPALRALFYGEGVFESFRWKGRAPVFLSMHLERMRSGAGFLGIPVPSESAVRLRIEEAVGEAEGEDLHVKACLLGDGDTVFHSPVPKPLRFLYPQNVEFVPPNPSPFASAGGEGLGRAAFFHTRPSTTWKTWLRKERLFKRSLMKFFFWIQTRMWPKRRAIMFSGSMEKNFSLHQLSVPFCPG